jgi:hypothetical protein
MFWTFAAVVAALVFGGEAAHAATSTNVLFVCEGELVKSDVGVYAIYQHGEHDYPMICDIPGKTLRQILTVCNLHDTCIVSAKGISSNGNRYEIQKVFEVQRPPQTQTCANDGDTLTLHGTIMQSWGREDGSMKLKKELDSCWIHRCVWLTKRTNIPTWR